ncbi:MAG: bifunctional phosphoribosylaminoimidazolecarboxamide formyltransferase/IMP cyclohydrolase [Candidatus Izemoplasma sp.]|nr:bifunctional phosphoribosylaminoimidazolecarboxamide formyltransferase/IMP cyclohydrolase [Candidatus Izemoplasma sp.]
MKRALLSVSDKTDIATFAKGLIQHNYEIISTGGTLSVLQEHDIPTTPVEEITHFPEMLDGRVKTLHPVIHGGLLARRDIPRHMKTLNDHNILPIDLVCVNLYPFEATIQQADIAFDDAIEQIDIGGPSMLRSAAKNMKDVVVICDPLDYDTILTELNDHNDIQLKTKRQLGAKVFRHTAYYDSVIAEYLRNDTPLFKEKQTIGMTYNSVLRYGENPHQQAALYQTTNTPYSLFNAQQLHGKELSYNNIQDANAALNILKEHRAPTVVGLKHMNPCGVASHKQLHQACLDAIASDPISIFGGIVALNGSVTESIASALSKIFLEIVIAPEFTDDALTILKKKKNLRLLQLDTSTDNSDRFMLTQINGGVLVQETDHLCVTKDNLTCVTKTQPTNQDIEDMLFAWRVVKHVKSNAIVVTKGTKTVGIGAGQMNRVGAAEIALKWAKDHDYHEGLTLASDAFFPFDDVVKLANQYGVTNIIQPGGSIRDKDSIKACNELGITMVFTQHRHFKH